MARNGLNCTLSYVDGSGSTRSYKVRVDQYGRTNTMVFEESHARTVRAFFPHRRAEDKFTINVILIGQQERRSFSSWLMKYSNYVLSSDLASGTFPAMQMNLPSRNALKHGIPLTGIEWGDHVGSMVWNHSVIFECVPNQISVSRASRSRDVNMGVDSANSYFYPDQTQLSANQAPPSYDQVLTYLAPDPTPSLDSNGHPVVTVVPSDSRSQN